MIKDNEIYCMPDDFEIGCILYDCSQALKSVETYAERITVEGEYANCMRILFKNGYGNVYTFDDFIELVNSKSIIDYDGMGYIVNKNGKEIESIECNVSWLKKHKKNNHYITWYNK